MIEPIIADPASFYTLRVAPIFDAHCVDCHGERRPKAQLRLDSFASLARGGKYGSVLSTESGRISELLRRVSLPPSDAEAMPPEGRDPMLADEVRIIELWVSAGASGALPVSAFKAAPQPVLQVSVPVMDEVVVRRERAALIDHMVQINERFPGLVAYESRLSADLNVNAAYLDWFGKAELGALSKLNQRIVRADFSGTAMRDDAISGLLGMPRLRILRLSDTEVTDAGLERLIRLKELRSVSVVGTKVTKSGLEALRAQGIQVYDGQI